jgi:hypothetical protein
LHNIFGHFTGGNTAMKLSSSCSRRFSLLEVRLAAGLLLALLLPASVLAQPVRSWAIAHDEGGFERAGCADCTTSYLPIRSLVRGRQALAADAAGNTYVTGFTTAYGTEDVLTVKYDSQGVKQWAVSYNGGDADRGFGVAVDAGGNVYVTGQSYAETAYGTQGQMLTLKYNANGVLQWQAQFGPGVSSAGLTLAVDASGNVYVAGEHYTTSDYVSMVTLKYSAAGVQQWARYAFYGYEYEESSAYDLALDAGGNVHVTGFLYKPSAPGIRDYMTVKYSPSGSQLWLRAFESGGVDEAYDVAVDSGGNVFVGGDSRVIKYDAAGTLKWASAFDGTAHALIAEGGAVYATGSKTGIASTSLTVARFDVATGSPVWSTALVLTNNERGYALRLVDGQIYVAGSSGANAVVAGFDSNTGLPSGWDVYDGGHNDVAYSIAANGTSDFWVAGTSGNGVDDDLLLMEYTRSTGPVLQSLTLSPASFAGACKTSLGKVTLSGPAPAGGAVVSLSNTNPAATVPASVTVPAGATTASFTVRGTVVSSPQNGGVTATYKEVAKSAVLTVRPIGVAALTVSPNPVTGPAMTQGMVTLECPAGAGGVTVTFDTSNSSVATPARPSLTVPAGSTTASFAVLTSDVSVESSATLRATAAGVWKGVKVTVRP